jgi:GNAT superfamily N-acetyltransferase
MSNLIFRHYDGQAAKALRDTVALIHRESYFSEIASDKPFNQPEPFMLRFDGYVELPGFRHVIGYLGDEPIGQTWGWPIARPTDPNSWQVAGLGPEPDEETAGRVFAFSEIMVRRPWTGHGYAHAVHDELLRPCTEKLAQLFVRPANTRAYRAYLHWGWRKVTQVRPDLPDAPVFDVLVLPLPISAA